MATGDIAAFDVDHTLTRRDCVLPFLTRVAGRARMVAALGRSLPLLAVAAGDRARRDEVKEALSRSVLAGRTATDVEQQGEEFAAEIAGRWLREDVVRRLDWHVEAGHRVVLVTASYAAYVRPLAELVGAAHVVATELEVVDGRLTGRLAGGNCRADEKVRRLAALFGDPLPLAWAYGDSKDDRPLLAAAHHGVVVDGSPLAPVPA